MQRAKVVALAFAALGGVMCQKNIARPPVEEVPIRGPEETAPPPPVPPPLASAKPGKDKPADKAPDPVATAPSSTPMFTALGKDDPPEPPRDRAFPKQADTCKKDEDCAATNLALGGEFLCCTPCRPVAGTRAWVRRVEQVCQQKTKAGLKSHCAPWDCSKAEAECRSGKCAVK